MIGIGGPLTILILTAISARYLTRSWLTPGAFFALLWSCFMLMPLLFAADFKVDTFGLWLPFVQVRSLEVITSQDNINVATNTLKIDIVFSIQQDPNTLDSVQVVIGESQTQSQTSNNSVGSGR